MKITVIGTGYVGLVAGTCFAETGNHVICVDVDQNKIANLKKGKIPIFEPGLEPLVLQNQTEGRLEFTTDLAYGINQSEICFIAVGTPPNEDGSADLKHVLNVVHEICRVATKRVVLGTKSTVPVGTGDKIEAILKEHCKQPFFVFSNPEFLKEGDAINDFMKPDRIIVGLNEEELKPLFKELYEPFMRQKERLIFMKRKSAELTKYAANAMLATRISFMNEIANLCEKVGANVKEVRFGLGSDPRIGPEFLYPGIGYGGSCFPKDVQAILKTAQEYNAKLDVVSAVEQANQFQKTVLFKKISTHFGNKLESLKFAVWGLAFKARTDDIRESPAIKLIEQLLKAGAQVSAFDPKAAENVEQLFGDRIQIVEHAYDCLNHAEALVIATEWNEFRSPDYTEIKKRLKNPVIFDGRNLLNSEHATKDGFTYYGIGI